MSLKNVEWSKISTELIREPHNLALYEKLIESAESNNKNGISKYSSKLEVNLLRISFENLLDKYPLLVNYWIRFAEWEFKLGNTDRANMIYKKSLDCLSYSIDLWISYLNFKINTISNNLMEVLHLFEAARSKIGYHFYAFEFYTLYLSFLKNYADDENFFSKKYFILLRIIIEIPIYHYDHFFKQLFQSINQISQEDLIKLVPKNDMVNFSNKDLKTSSLKLKKIFTDIYITTQYTVYQLYSFEKNISIHYFSDLYLSNQELATWENYLNFIELNYPMNYVISVYERCLISTSNYYKFWLRYANFFISVKKINVAKEILQRSIKLNGHHKLLIKLIDLELFTHNFLNARDILVSYIKSNLSIPLPIYEKLLNLERLINKDNDEYIIDLFTELINQTNNEWFFKIILNYCLPHDLLIKFFEKFEVNFKYSKLFNEALNETKRKKKEHKIDFKDNFDSSLKKFS